MSAAFPPRSLGAPSSRLIARQENSVAALRSLAGYAGNPLFSRGGVEADGGGGGQVEALGLAVDGYRDGLVGQREEVRGQPPRLVAEQPGGRAGQPGGQSRVVQAGR